MARGVTTDKVEKMLAGLRLGMTRRAASATAGYSKTTFYRMLENDADGTLGTAIEKAEAEAEATYTGIIAKATADPKNWTAAAWWLERRRPADFARHEKVEMTGKDGGPIDHRSISALPDHERQALADAIRTHLRGENEPVPDPASDSIG
jgi:hypothetical protein